MGYERSGLERYAKNRFEKNHRKKLWRIENGFKLI
jgi:hypothetical protein